MYANVEERKAQCIAVTFSLDFGPIFPFVTLGMGVWSDLGSSSAKAVLQTFIQPLTFKVLSQARSVTGDCIQDGR